MFNHSPDNLRIPPFLRFVIAVECSVVFTGAVLLFLFPTLAKTLWAWDIPPFNARFVGAIYFAAYVPLIIFWFNPYWTPGRFILWMIFVFTALIMVVMIFHVDAFAWNRMSTYLVFWPLYIFLPINTSVFLYLSRAEKISNPTDMPALWRKSLTMFALFGTGLGIGLLIAPEALTGFWPWPVDAFHGRIYASAFITPSVGAWILSRRASARSEYFIFGLNLLTGGILPIIGTLLTNISVPPERQINFNALGTWAFFALFFMAGILGAIQIVLAFQKSTNLENK